MSKSIVLLNGPGVDTVVDSDFGGLPVIALNFAARRRRFRGIQWWVSFLAQECDKRLAEAAGGVKVMACELVVRGFFRQLDWTVDLEQEKVREAAGLEAVPPLFHSVSSALALALYLGHDEADVYGWDQHRGLTREMWDFQGGEVDKLVAAGLKVHRIGYASHQQADLTAHPRDNDVNREARRICEEITPTLVVSSPLGRTQAAILPIAVPDVELDRHAAVCAGCADSAGVVRDGINFVRCRRYGSGEGMSLHGECPAGRWAK